MRPGLHVAEALPVFFGELPVLSLASAPVRRRVRPGLRARRSGTAPPPRLVASSQVSAPLTADTRVKLRPPWKPMSSVRLYLSGSSRSSVTSLVISRSPITRRAEPVTVADCTLASAASPPIAARAALRTSSILGSVCGLRGHVRDDRQRRNQGKRQRQAARAHRAPSGKQGPCMARDHIIRRRSGHARNR